LPVGPIPVRSAYEWLQLTPSSGPVTLLSRRPTTAVVNEFTSDLRKYIAAASGLSRLSSNAKCGIGRRFLGIRCSPRTVHLTSRTDTGDRWVPTNGMP
jgi:hypothetical protein